MIIMIMIIENISSILIIKRGRIKRGCSQKQYLQIGGKTVPRHIQNTGRVP